MFSSESSPAGKAERTRDSIRSAALASFRTRGYDDTTIRLIASEVGVSVGNAYYHFPTKNHLVQELYLEVQTQHSELVADRVAASDDLIERVGIVLHGGLDTLAPFHEFAPGFLSAAMSPRSPINPLGGESQPARDIAVATFAQATSGADRAIPAEFRGQLPEVLLLAYLLVALFWVYDRSPAQERSHRLVERALALARVALPLLKLPLLRKPLRDLFGMIAEVQA